VVIHFVVLSKHLAGRNEENQEIAQDNPFLTRDLNQRCNASAGTKKYHVRSALVTMKALLQNSIKIQTCRTSIAANTREVCNNLAAMRHVSAFHSGPSGLFYIHVT
jgi:hypothetical protein